MKKLNQKCCCFADNVKKRFRKGKCGKCMSPLSQHCNKGTVTIKQVKGDRKQCARMADMGLYPGTKAELICGNNGKQCILKVNGGTVCLDRTITENILVTES